MNKLFIVLLAVCLVTVQAYVKREAPATPATGDANIETYINQFKAGAEKFGSEFSEKFKEALDPEKIQKGFNDLVGEISKLTKPATEKKE